MPVIEATSALFPPVPITIEGSSVLHQMMRLRWADWRRASEKDRTDLASEAARVLAEMEAGGANASASFSLLGHKGDLMFVHFRDSFDELDDTESRLRKLALFDFLEPTASYLSMVELGLYESTQKVYAALTER